MQKMFISSCFEASLCEYNNAACRARQKHTTLYMQYYGKCINMATPCIELNHTRCPTSAHASAYVCGSDGRTYSEQTALNFLTLDNTIQYNTIQYNTIQYNTIQYNTIQYNAICNKIQGWLYLKHVFM